jgi:hypothetical protein
MARPVAQSKHHTVHSSKRHTYSNANLYCSNTPRGPAQDVVSDRTLIPDTAGAQTTTWPHGCVLCNCVHQLCCALVGDTTWMRCRAPGTSLVSCCACPQLWQGGHVLRWSWWQTPCCGICWICCANRWLAPAKHGCGVLDQAANTAGLYPAALHR